MAQMDGLRSPICLIVGDSKVGKSTLLRMLGCETNNPKTKFEPQISYCYQHKADLEYLAKKQQVERKLGNPGLLMIELPSNTGELTRTRLLGVADIAVVVLDALIGLTSNETALIKSVFGSVKSGVIVLNKTDDAVKQEINEVNEKVKELGATQNIVCCSALKGEGIAEFLEMLFQVSDTLDRRFLGKKAECKVLAVQSVLGHGTLLLVVVVDGVLYAKDTVVVSSTEGPIVSKMKALWLPPKSGGLLVAEGPYDKEEEEIRAGRAVLVALKDAGSGSILDLNLQVLGPDDDVEKLKTIAKCDYHTARFQLHMRAGIPIPEL